MQSISPRSLFGAALLICGVCSVPAQAAEQPTGGCGKGFTLTGVSELQALVPGFDFSAYDRNGDGQLCNRFLPEPAGTGVIHDNTTRHNRT